MKVLITGAQFSNKGAQAMLYSVVNELRLRYRNIAIYYVPIDDFRKYNPEQYQFIITYDDQSYLDRKYNIKLFLKRYAKCFFNSLRIAAYWKKKGVKKYSNVISNIDVLIDISGFSLSDRFSRETSNRYLRYIENAEKNGANVILMPQSFGPFDYQSGKMDIENKIKKILPKVDLIFAREKEGKVLLENLYHLTNVHMSLDSVLQASPLKKGTVMVCEDEMDLPVIETEHNVGIIPNKQTVIHGDGTKVLEVYKEIINKLMNLGKHVYIFRHSDDIELCKKIYEMFEANDKVHLITKDMSCIEYSEFIKNFDYVIASRYHAIVHAYKEHVPAIILGWAVKYIELAKVFDQCKYMYDLGTCSIDEVIQAIDNMDKKYFEENKKIMSICEEVTYNTCFDQCWLILDRMV